MTDIKDDDFNDLDDYDDDEEPVSDKKEEDVKKYACAFWCASTSSMPRTPRFRRLASYHSMQSLSCFLLDSLTHSLTDSPHLPNNVVLSPPFRDSDIYASIHASGFKEFLLKPELIRAIGDCGFEHPSEGTPTTTYKPLLMLLCTS
jgi:hypothetical protein